ncbi:MAG TPA: DUF423 domain-containing protein [Anaerolineae bacterium]|nr:DUF423 domain-containing protein [Anaerolineae bacterium]
MDRLFFVLGTLFGGLSVALGAFGAHALEGRIETSMLANYETAARYQMYHALALIAVAWAVTRWPASTLPVWAGWAFVAGIVLFSGSLYVMAFTGVRWLGAITPFGGVAMAAGWLLLLLAAWRHG